MSVHTDGFIVHGPIAYRDHVMTLMEGWTGSLKRTESQKWVMSHPNVRVPRRQNMLFKVTFIIKRAYLVLYHNNILC